MPRSTSPRQLQLITSADAKPCATQPTKPCSDCPWARTALPGWLGGFTPEEWLQAAHGEERIDCHTLKGPQCAGATIYRANVLKSVRDPQLLKLKRNVVDVFTSPGEFLKHHKR
jgi:hypothetical protein